MKDYGRVLGEINAIDDINDRINNLEDDLEEALTSISEGNLRLSVPYAMDEGKTTLGFKVEGERLLIYSAGAQIGYLDIL